MITSFDTERIPRAFQEIYRNIDELRLAIALMDDKDRAFRVWADLRRVWREVDELEFMASDRAEHLSREH